MIFYPIEKSETGYPNKLYEKIIVSINDMILSGKLKHGDKLPSERELAEQFNTSRVPVREALKILEFMGIVESINGDGMHIKNIEIPSLMNKIFFAFSVNESTIQDLFEVRLLLECYSARRAATMRDQDDLQRMAKAIEDMDKEIHSGEVSIKSTMDFHVAVVMATKNSILVDVHKFLSSLFEKSRERTLGNRIQHPSTLAFHREIYRAIEKQDIEGADRGMREHLLDEKNKKWE